MDRREFLTSTTMALGATAGVAGASGVPGTEAAAFEKGGGTMAGPGGKDRAYFELRRYELRQGPMVDRMHDYLKSVSIPALNRAGVGPVGVFTPSFGALSPMIYFLLPYKSIQAFAGLSAALDGDAEFKKAAEPHATLPATDPAYLRVHSQLMAAATFMPAVEVPPAAEGNKPRIFELRTYESHSLRARRMKLQMFGELGELAIFRRTGLRPVFFGDNVVGDRLPSFTYMLTFDDMAAREKNWGAFIGDSEWQTLRAKPGYTDPEIVSNITSIILRPTGYSQI
jgi:hypothetical protein